MSRLRITILTMGTRGDVEPFIALALGLNVAGYEVTLGADTEFESVIRARAVPFAPLELNLRQYLNSDEGKMEIQHGKLRRANRGDSFAPMVRRMLDDCWMAARGANALIYDTMLTPAYHIAEKLGIPAIMTSVMPNMSPTAAFPLIGGPKIRMGRLGNKLSYQVYRLGWISAHGKIKRWCQETLAMKAPSRFKHYGLRNGKPIPVLYAYSQLVLPSPPDWNKDTLASGYWLLKRNVDWQPPAALKAFLATGPAPVYVGFGSMTGTEPERLTDLVVSALEMSGERGILVTGWGGMVNRHLPESVLCLSEAPHEWLFPQVKAVVHHGGAGTTAAGLRAGAPSIVCPFVTDQFFWGDLVRQRGFGPAPIPQRELTAARLASAIRSAVVDVSMRQRVEVLAKSLRQEDGVGRAVEFINERLRLERKM